MPPGLDVRFSTASTLSAKAFISDDMAFLTLLSNFRSPALIFFSMLLMAVLTVLNSRWWFFTSSVMSRMGVS